MLSTNAIGSIGPLMSATSMESQVSADEEMVEESDKKTIKKVYDKYMQEYNRMPHSVDLFIGFAKQFHDVKISFASAKSFLDEINQTPPISTSTSTSTSPSDTPTFLAPNFAKMKVSSISTPNVLTNSNIRKKKKLKANLNEKYQSVNDLQLLKDIKAMIMNMKCIKNNQQIINELNNTIWNNADCEYYELTKRLARGVNRRNVGYHLRPSLHQPSLSKDENFLSLKNLSQRVDVDDVEHDVSVYLLKTFYRDDNVGHDGDYDFDEKEEALSLYDSMVLKYRKTMGKELSPQPDQLKSHKSAPAQSSNINMNMPFVNVSKRLSLSLNEHIRPDFSYISHASDLPVMDKAFRALSTVSGSSFETMSVGTDTLVAFETEDEDEEKDKKAQKKIVMDAESPFVDKNFLDVMAKYESKMDCWDFNVFEFMDDPVFCGKGLVYLSFYLFRKVGLLDSTGVSQPHLWRFFEMVANGYLDTNPYHNQYHAVDVLLNTHFFFQSDFLKSHMTQWDMFAAYIAAVCHDLGHMGFNNGWYVNTAGNLALLYGDDSVLENYHLNETFRLLNKPASNWMLSFTSSIRKYLATVIKDCILATDVKHHGVQVHQLQNMINVFKKEVSENKYDNFNSIQLQKCQSIASYASIEAIKRDGFKLFMHGEKENEFDGDIIVNDMGTNVDDEDEDEKCDKNMPIQPRIDGVLDERLFILGITIHTCDVANPCKPLDLSIKWANNYLQEVFMQGDTERSFGIPVSPGMDRNTTKLPNSQIGFITYVVKRLFELYSQLIDSKDADKCLELMRENEKHWIQKKKEATIYKVAKVPGLVSISEAKSTNPKSVKFKDST